MNTVSMISKAQARGELQARIQDAIDSSHLSSETELLLRDCLAAIAAPHGETVAYLMTNIESGDVVATIDTEGYERSKWSRAPLVLADVHAEPGFYNAQQIKDSHRFFAYCPEIGAVWHEKPDDAAQDAAMRIAYYRSAANDDGEWSGDVEEVYWGELKGRAIANVDANGTDYSLESIEGAGEAPALEQVACDSFERLGSAEVWNIVQQVARQLAAGTAKLSDMLTAVDAYGLACKTEAKTPAGFVKADQALHVETIFAELRDLWTEALAVDKATGRPVALRERIAKLRDAVGQAANGYIPLGGKLRPIHITVLIDWLNSRYLAAGGKEGITDLSAWSEEVMRWTERQHRISFEEAQG